MDRGDFSSIFVPLSRRCETSCFLRHLAHLLMRKKHALKANTNQSRDGLQSAASYMDTHTAAPGPRGAAVDATVRRRADAPAADDRLQYRGGSGREASEARTLLDTLHAIVQPKPPPGARPEMARATGRGGAPLRVGRVLAARPAAPDAPASARPQTARPVHSQSARSIRELRRRSGVSPPAQDTTPDAPASARPQTARPVHSQSARSIRELRRRSGVSPPAQDTMLGRRQDPSHSQSTASLNHRSSDPLYGDEEAGPSLRQAGRRMSEPLPQARPGRVLSGNDRQSLGKRGPMLTRRSVAEIFTHARAQAKQIQESERKQHQDTAQAAASSANTQRDSEQLLMAAAAAAAAERIGGIKLSRTRSRSASPKCTQRNGAPEQGHSAHALLPPRGGNGSPIIRALSGNRSPIARGGFHRTPSNDDTALDDAQELDRIAQSDEAYRRQRGLIRKALKEFRPSADDW